MSVSGPSASSIFATRSPALFLVVAAAVVVVALCAARMSEATSWSGCFGARAARAAASTRSSVLSMPHSSRNAADAPTRSGGGGGCDTQQLLVLSLVFLPLPTMHSS